MWLDFLISTDIITEKLYCLSSFQENDTEDQIICVWVCVCVCEFVCECVCECMSVWVCMCWPLSCVWLFATQVL